MKYYCPYCGSLLLLNLDTLLFSCNKCPSNPRWNLQQIHTNISTFTGASAMPYPKRKGFHSSDYGTVTVTWNPDIEAYECTFPYNQNFIDLIKSQIPTNERSLDFDRSRPQHERYKWMFSQRALETVLLPLMRATFPHSRFSVTDKKKVDEYNQGYKPPTIPIDKDSLKREFRQIVQSVGVSLEQTDRKQYLKAAMFLHPDRNSSPEAAKQMSRLNEIWSTVFVEKTEEEKVI